MKRFFNLNAQVYRSKGFTIVGVLIAAGLLGVLALVFSKLITGSMKGQQAVSQRVDRTTQTSSLNLILGRGDLCAKALYTSETSLLTKSAFAPKTAIPIDSIRMGTSKIVQLGKNGAGPTNTGIQIQVIETSSSGSEFSVLLPGDVDPTLVSREYGALEVTSQIAAAGGSGTTDATASFPMEFLFRASGELAYCGTDGFGAAGSYQFRCEEPNSYMVEVGPEGMICKATAFPGGACAQDEIMYGITSNGQPMCRPGPVDRILTRPFTVATCRAGTNGTCNRKLNLKSIFPELNAPGVDLERVTLSNVDISHYPDNLSTGCTAQSSLALQVVGGRAPPRKNYGGKKGYWFEASFDGNNDYAVNISSGAWKWGGCGGNTCGGCMDGGTVTVLYTEPAPTP